MIDTATTPEPPSDPARLPPALFLLVAAQALRLEAQSEQCIAECDVFERTAGHRRVRAARLQIVERWLRAVAGKPGASLTAVAQGSA